MPESNLRSLTMTSKGQITISSRARKALGLDKGDTLIEMVVGNCIVLLPENQILAETARQAHEAIKLVSVEQIVKEADKLRKERTSKRNMKTLTEMDEEQGIALSE